MRALRTLPRPSRAPLRQATRARRAASLVAVGCVGWIWMKKSAVVVVVGPLGLRRRCRLRHSAGGATTCDGNYRGKHCCAEAGSLVAAVWLPARGRPEQARRVGLEGVGILSHQPPLVLDLAEPPLSRDVG
jgi:hypothetical protein